MNPKVQALYDEAKGLIGQAKSLSEVDGLTEQQSGQIDDLLKKAEELEAKARRMETILEREAALTAKEAEEKGRNVQVTTAAEDKPFETEGEFFKAVKQAAYYPAQADPRLMSRKATGLSEGVPADGGYLLQETTSSRIIEAMWKQGEILSRVTKDPVGPNSNSASYNGVDETSRVDGSRKGGIRGYWVAEGGTITASKPKFRKVDLKLRKVAALCYATDEQLEDTVNLAAWLGRSVPDELRFKVEDAIFEGNGVGMPLGILNSPALVSVLREATSNISTADIYNMWARRYAGVSDYVWYIHQDVMPELDTLVIGTDAPPRMVEYGTDGILRMKGRPVIEVEYAQTLGTQGDILLASMSQYQAIEKGGIKSETSIHVAFTTDEMAFRFIYRIDGAPLWHSAVTPFHGSNTVSPFVALSAATA